MGSQPSPVILCEDDHTSLGRKPVPKATCFFRNAESGRVKAVCNLHFERIKDLRLSKIVEITEDEYIVYLIMDS